MNPRTSLIYIYLLALILILGTACGSSGGNGGENPPGAPDSPATPPSLPPVVIIDPTPPDDEIDLPEETCTLVFDGQGNAYGIVGRHAPTKTIKTKKHDTGEDVYLDESGIESNPNVQVVCE